MNTEAARCVCLISNDFRIRVDFHQMAALIVRIEICPDDVTWKFKFWKFKSTKINFFTFLGRRTNRCCNIPSAFPDLSCNTTDQPDPNQDFLNFFMVFVILSVYNSGAQMAQILEPRPLASCWRLLWSYNSKFWWIKMISRYFAFSCKKINPTKLLVRDKKSILSILTFKKSGRGSKFRAICVPELICWPKTGQ